MKLLVIGGGEGQINAVRRARREGFKVFVSDRDPNCPGAAEADCFLQADTFSPEETIVAAKDAGIEAVMTLGTDQPVYTAARVASEMNLYFGISPETALAVTNKRLMKPLFTENGIPSARYGLIGSGFSENDLAGLEFPLVVKPVDSQGQRGVYRAGSFDELSSFLPDVLSYSRESRALVEEYYPSGEITVSGWSVEGKFYPLTVTDRVTISNGPHIGVCTSHEYPSRFFPEYGEDIIAVASLITEVFNIRNGPVYIQMLIGANGVKVNEVASRIGGAYEDQFIPAVTGVDILDLQFTLASKGVSGSDSLRQFRFPSDRFGTVILFFTGPGTVRSNGDMEKILNLPSVTGGKYLLKPGFTVGNRENSTARAGYVVFTSDSPSENRCLKKKIYSLLEVQDINGNNIVCEYP